VRSDAISGRNITEWDDYFRIDVSSYIHDIDRARQLKSESTDALVNALDEWQTSKLSFADAVALEIRDAGKQYMDDYLQMTSRYAIGDMSALVDSPMAATVVEQMMHWLLNNGDFGSRIERCISFFQSKHFSEVPHEWLWSHMFATFKEMVKRGSFADRNQARKRLSGFLADLKHICFYAPYCDAIFIDKYMADLVGRPTVNIEQRYKVSVFSLSNFDAFIGWLQELEKGMSAEHREGVAAAYPGKRI
jgi:hypothetical protein